jgi:hypothetical protein
MSLEDVFGSDPVLSIMRINRIENVIGRVENIADLIASSENLERVRVSESLHEDLKERILDAIISNPRVTILEINCGIRTPIPLVLQLLREMISLHSVEVYDLGSAPYMDKIFSALHTSTTLQNLAVRLTSEGNENVQATADSLCRYLGDDCALMQLELLLWNWDRSMESAFVSVCESIGKCSSLRCLTVVDQGEEAVNMEQGVADAFASAIVNSSLEDVCLEEFEESTMDRICEALSRTDAVKDFELTFCQVDDKHLKLSRKWKPFLGDNLPLSSWPHILKEAEDWVESSQSRHSTDIHYYLVRQMCPSLIRNLP